MRVGIIGGGIGGAALALALLQQGIDAHLFERAPAFGEVGAGIQVTPNAVKIIRAMGLMEALRTISFTPQALVGRNWKTAREMWRTPLAEDCPRLYGAPFFHVHRADLHALFARRIPAERVTFARACSSVARTPSGAVASFADGGTFEADLIVGADGIHSVVRASLFGTAPARFTGNMCYRAVVPYDKQPLEYVSPDSSFWLGPQAHVVTYYVRGGRAVNIVAVTETASWVEESWNVPSSREELLDAFTGWHPNLQRLFGQADNVFKWGLFDRDPMPRWSDGAITLLGDAAHPMLPFLSQGAGMAIEDAFVLASCLAAGPDVAGALSAYEARRLPRTRRVQLESRERGRTYHLSSPLALWRRDMAYRLRSLINPHRSGIKANWIYEHDATLPPEPTASAA
ncbi:FAD-dependent monooxygenase [Gluconacetobacter azotocaptans]|uniref:FAD-dependent monooxygenase n=1 Tax=Gluconacetobacter azotocaptans TaxID=142834 RepID=UPI00195D5E95|nr:FAD-dependent monooxygenase [Gluconacetobacter azotocaptans]MBM9400279.1 FAD-dependent monooxygenase [Gluconacetobacter azotocaptans]